MSANMKKMNYGDHSTLKKMKIKIEKPKNT